MPNYRYVCEQGHETTRMKPVDKRNEPIDCPDCENEADRDFLKEMQSRTSDEYENFIPYLDENLADEDHPEGYYVTSREQKEKLKDEQNLREKGSYVE